MKIITMLALFGFLLVAAPVLPGAYGQSDFVPDSLRLFWPAPVRAHPLVPVEFRFIAYDPDNEELEWSLENQPAGMQIDNDGIAHWIPSRYEEGSSYDVTVNVANESGDSVSRQFRLTVDSDEFIFVAKSGSDQNPGSIGSPMRTIEAAMRKVQNGDGKSILIRDGVYQEVYSWADGETNPPFILMNFTAEDPVVVRSYPNEQAILDCQNSGHGLFAELTSYVVFSNIEVRNATSPERAGIEACQSHHVVIHDAIVKDSDWSSCENVTGYKLIGSEIVVSHCIGIDNRDRVADCHLWNSTNFVTYNDSLDFAGDTFLLQCKSIGSVVGFKIKHSGPGRTIFHGCTSVNEDVGFVVGSEYSSARHCVAFNSEFGVIVGFTDQTSLYNYPDVESFVRKSVLVEHNTVVNASMAGIAVWDDYCIEEPAIIVQNLVYNQFLAGTGEHQNRLFSLWIYDHLRDYRANDLDLISNGNLFSSPNSQNIIHLGGDSDGRNWNYDLPRWRNSFGRGLQSKFGDPGFANVSKGDLSIPANSLAAKINGSFAGAFRPGRIYPRVTDFRIQHVCSEEGLSESSIDIYASPQIVQQASPYLFARNAARMASGEVRDIATVDINGDGLDEIVMLKDDGHGAQYAEVYAGLGPGSHLPVDLAFLDFNPIISMTGGDFTGDGIEELALLVDDNGDHNLYIVDISNGVSSAQIIAADLWQVPAGNNSLDLAAIDLDSDGIDELAVLKPNGSNLGLYYYSVPASGYHFSTLVAKDVWSNLMTEDLVSIAAGDFVGSNPGEEMAVVVRDSSGRQKARIYHVRKGWHFSQLIASDPWYICHRYRVNQICDYKTIGETGITVWRYGRAKYPPCQSR